MRKRDTDKIDKAAFVIMIAGAVFMSVILGITLLDAFSTVTTPVEINLK